MPTSTDLASIHSPFSSTTIHRHAKFSGCGSTAGETYKFFVVLQPGQKITVGQTTNSFDSKHSVFWSESANPAAYPSGSGSTCTDDPDTRTVTMTFTTRLWVGGGVPKQNHSTQNKHTSTRSHKQRLTLLHKSIPSFSSLFV